MSINFVVEASELGGIALVRSESSLRHESDVVDGDERGESFMGALSESLRDSSAADFLKEHGSLWR